MTIKQISLVSLLFSVTSITSLMNAGLSPKEKFEKLLERLNEESDKMRHSRGKEISGAIALHQRSTKDAILLTTLEGQKYFQALEANKSCEQKAYKKALKSRKIADVLSSAVMVEIKDQFEFDPWEEAKAICRKEKIATEDALTELKTTDEYQNIFKPALEDSKKIGVKIVIHNEMAGSVKEDIKNIKKKLRDEEDKQSLSQDITIAISDIGRKLHDAITASEGGVKARSEKYWLWHLEENENEAIIEAAKKELHSFVDQILEELEE